MNNQFDQLGIEKMKQIIAESNFIAEVIQKVGLGLRGGNYKTFAIWAAKHKIDLTELYARSRQHITAQANARTALSSEEVFNAKRPLKGSMLKKHMLAEGIPYVCAICNQLPIWNKRELVLQVDHIDGNHCNQQKENLRFVCPNCHSQTEHYAGKSSKKNLPPWVAPARICPGCNNPISKKSTRSKMCKLCASKQRESAKYPPKEELGQLVQQMTLERLAVQLGVSSNAIRKKCHKWNIQWKH